MAQTNINIRIDENLKHDFDAVCRELGLTMTAAFNVFAKTVARQKAIPFELSAVEDPFFSASNMERLRKSIAQMEATGGTIHNLD